jgi:Cu2+-exporting ATPase
MWILLAAQVPLAWLQLIDEPRPESKSVVAWFRDRGYAIGLLSGDGAKEGRRIAGLLAITDITTDATPDAKVLVVQQRQAAGARLLMVGDGLNDTPAMAGAHVSIAVSPVDVVVQGAADATLLTNSLGSLPLLIRFSKKVRRIIRQNVSWAIAYNLLVIPLAVTGLLQPWMAALGMSLSSLFVVFNANRLRKVRD